MITTSQAVTSQRKDRMKNLFIALLLASAILFGLPLQARAGWEGRANTAAILGAAAMAANYRATGNVGLPYYGYPYGGYGYGNYGYPTQTVCTCRTYPAYNAYSTYNNMYGNYGYGNNYGGYGYGKGNYGYPYGNYGYGYPYGGMSYPYNYGYSMPVTTYPNYASNNNYWLAVLYNNPQTWNTAQAVTNQANRSQSSINWQDTVAQPVARPQSNIDWYDTPAATQSNVNWQDTAVRAQSNIDWTDSAASGVRAQSNIDW